MELQTRGGFDEFARNPALYDYSPGKLCCEYLLRTLQELLGVRYNPARIADPNFQNPLSTNPDFRDSRDLFIHGMMGGPGGTCASMPVMYAAVGRRRGYPLKLFEAPTHLFLRWDDPEGERFNVPEVFNVEGTGHGISIHPDDYYRTWPREWTRTEKNAEWYLKSLSPREELAVFLSTRGSCLEDNGQIEGALQAFKWATQLVPDDLRYKGKLCALLNTAYEASLQAMAAERQMLEFERMKYEQIANRPENAHWHGSGPPHGGSCQCLHCHQARQAMRQTQMPGHPAGCGCFNCRNVKSNPLTAYPKTASEKGTVPFCSEDCAKFGTVPGGSRIGY